MTGGVLPFALMFAAIGLALSSVSSKVAWLSVAGVALISLLLSWLSIPEAVLDVVYGGFWLSMVATGVVAILERGVPQAVVIGAAINAGAWSGALAAASDMRHALAIAFPLSLSFVVGKWLGQRGLGIVSKVLCSWLVAIGALALLVSLVPTPGYESDHME